MRKWIIGVMSVVTLGLFLFIGGYLVIYLNGQKLLMENLEKLDMAQTSIVYDKNGNEYMKLFTENRKLVTLDQVPALLEEAVIATEDQRFGEHAGIDLWAIGRAIFRDIVARDLVEGGSTITQQVAKNMFLSAEKTFFRKATEMSIALALENNFSKEEILEMYLNEIYFGNGAYGVKSAAEVHFGVSDLNDLTLTEMAVLAALPKAPESYSPSNNPEKARERMEVVLMLMADQGYITETERREALNTEWRTPSGSSENKTNAMRYYILEQASAVTGLSEQELRIGGFHIYTTVDPAAQGAVDRAFDNPELFPKDGPEQIAQGAMVIVDTETGGIAAMSGGRDYVAKGLNRALAKRQPGSAFKPIAVYAPALEEGYTPYSMLKDEQMKFGNYEPRNLSGRYAGEVTMFEAVQRSINVPAVWLLNEIGVETGMEFAEKLGIELSGDDRNLAIALGGLTNGATPLEMARAYSAFANGGRLAESYVIERVEDAGGHSLYTHEPSSEQVMSDQTAYYTTLLLQSVTQEGGTGTRANFGRPVAGKTGTTQLGIKGVSDSSGNRDIWFAGYTPEYAAAVWMGFDATNKEHYLTTGSGAAAALFAKVMSETLKGREVQSFPRPEGVEPPKKPLDGIADLAAAYEPERHEAVLSWSAVESASEVEYRLYRKSSAQEQFELIANTPATQVYDISLERGETYQYYVTIFNLQNETESEASNTVDVIVPLEGEGSGDGFDLPILDGVVPGEQNPEEGSGSGEDEAGGGDDSSEGAGGTNDGPSEENNDGNASDSGQDRPTQNDVTPDEPADGDTDPAAESEQSGETPEGSEQAGEQAGEQVVRPEGI